MSPGLAVQQAMRAALLARPPLTTLLGGAHVFDEVPRGANPPYVLFAGLETRDWSVIDQKAHEHFISLEVVTSARSRALAQNICTEIELALDNASLTLTDHKLVNLRAIFSNTIKSISTNHFGAVLRFRAATEPL
ncbi:MAG: DUF3168 domain-containing protein [Alphaproteobacteria bacterium]|nr:DUF3168 domain-containing protein [Alphaproteobacteria bacterium]